MERLFQNYSTRAQSVGLKYCNTAEAQEKDLKLILTNIIEVLEEEINESLKKTRKMQTVGGRPFKL